MKYWPTQIFPLLVLTVLAALSFWLRQSANDDNPGIAKVLKHEPDAIGENIIARRFDETGRLQYRLVSPHIEHFPDDDSSELKTPTLYNYRHEAPPLSIYGDHARITSKGEVVYLWDNVKAVRPADEARQELIARMPDLTAYPDAGTAFTDSPVEITQGVSWITGIGMNLDNNTSTMVLRSRVRGEYIQNRAKP